MFKKYKYYLIVIILLAIIAIWWHNSENKVFDGRSNSIQTNNEENKWKCNCKKTCPQMTSCEEAYYQLNDCGCSIRDGDKDGVPCENICK